MSRWRRRIRGLVGMGLMWGGAWFGAGMVLLAIIGLDAADVPFPLFFGLLGFLSGAAFAGILAMAEGRRRFDQMSIPRFAVWGAVGGLLLSGIVFLAAGPGGEFAVIGPVFALAGAVSAAGSLALARRGAQRTLPSAAPDQADPALADGEGPPS